MPVIQILVVDDFLPWQQFVQGMLESESDLKIIASATNGLEAVQKAVDLRPAIILMDVDLPKVNGFEATRQIRMRSPASQILFLSERRGRDLIEAAFQAGGCGYILKSDAYSDLLTGIRAILHGQKYISHSLIDWGDVTDQDKPGII